MALFTRTFCVFVSPTFSDLKAERNTLRENVFPRLRELATAHIATPKLIFPKLYWTFEPLAQTGENLPR